MPNSPMALRAINFGAMCGQLRNKRFVTPNAVVLDNSQTAAFDLNRLVKILKSKALAMPQPVLDLRQILADQIVRHVAVVAHRESVMARLLPTVVLLAHDVTVDAGGRIVGQIRPAAGLDEGEAADANEHADQRREHNARDGDSFRARGHGRMIASPRR